MRRLSFPLLALLALASCETPDKEGKAASKTTPAPQPEAPVAASKTKPDSLATFTWQDEMCEHVGAYPAGTYTEKQLRDTYGLVNFAGILTSTTVFRLEQYTDAHFAKAGKDLEREHDSLATSLQQAAVVPTAYWMKIKSLRTRELEEEYQFCKFALAGYYKPSSLQHNQYYSSCKEYADALASNDTTVVMLAWRKLKDAQKLNNGAPEALEQRFIQESAAPERMKYAKIELMTFGWYNCALQQTKYRDLPEQYHLQENYHKLFKSVKSDCEDVD